MNSLNSILLEGIVVREPVSSETEKGTRVTHFTVESYRFYRVNDQFEKQVSYFDVEAWGKLADRAADELNRGRGVRAVGRLAQDRWVDADGRPRSRVKIVAEHLEFRRPRNDVEPTMTEAEAEELRKEAGL